MKLIIKCANKEQWDKLVAEHWADGTCYNSGHTFSYDSECDGLSLKYARSAYFVQHASDRFEHYTWVCYNEYRRLMDKHNLPN